MMKKEKAAKKTKNKKFDVFYLFLSLFFLLTAFAAIYPFWNTFAVSFSSANAVLRGDIYFIPKDVTLESYKAIFRDSEILRAYFITISRTVLGIATTILFTGLLAYGLSKKQLIGRKFYLIFCVVAMIFNAGLIPTYMLYNDINLLDNFLVFVLPRMVSVWYMILMKTYFESLPKEIEESAEIDGCGPLRAFVSIVIPISMPLIATISIFVGVDQWNQWFDGYMFINNPNLEPLQTYLYRVIALNKTPIANSAQSLELARMKTNTQTVQSATVIITTLPIIFIYALFQKHFTKGIMIGALKG